MTQALSATTMQTTPAPVAAEDQLIAQWLHCRSPHTQDAYRTAVRGFRASCDAPLDHVTLGDLQG